VVILDSAPLLVKSDALVLARYVNGSIIVLESEKTTRRAVNELMEVLARAHIRPLGFVLNRFSIEKGKYFYHHFYYGHDGRALSTSESSQ
jgi:Mrp family chromosome partitioning ATPase